MLVQSMQLRQVFIKPEEIGTLRRRDHQGGSSPSRRVTLPRIPATRCRFFTPIWDVRKHRLTGAHDGRPLLGAPKRQCRITSSRCNPSRCRHAPQKGTRDAVGGDIANGVPLHALGSDRTAIRLLSRLGNVI